MNSQPRGPLGILGDDSGIAQIGAELVARPNGITLPIWCAIGLLAWALILRIFI